MSYLYEGCTSGSNEKNNELDGQCSKILWVITIPPTPKIYRKNGEKSSSRVPFVTKQVGIAASSLRAGYTSSFNKDLSEFHELSKKNFGCSPFHPKTINKWRKKYFLEVCFSPKKL